MSDIQAADVKALRERTGIDIEIPGIWHCTKIKLQELRDEGILPPGSNHLDDLGNLSGYWKTDPRGTTHDAGDQVDILTAETALKLGRLVGQRVSRLQQTLTW